MTKFEEHIYNTFLRISRSRQNKPFKLRKDFSDFEKDPNYIYILKLQLFFNKFKHVNVEEFFEAPYFVYPEKTYYNLDFYLSPKAIKVYTIFNKSRNDSLPDSELQLQFVRKSLFFIYKFCKEHKISICDYIKHETGLFPSFIIHLKEHEISIYVLFGWDEFEDEFAKINQEEVKFILSHLYDNISKYRTQYFQSTKCKNLVKEGIKKIDESIKIQKPQ